MYKIKLFFIVLFIFIFVYNSFSSTNNEKENFSLKNHKLSIFWGGGNKMSDFNTQFSEILVSFAPTYDQTSFFEIGFQYHHIKSTNDDQRFKQVSLISNFIAANRGVLSFGLSAFNDNQSEDFPNGYIIIPYFHLKLGNLKKFYISLNFLNEFLYFPISYGFHINLQYFYLHLYLGFPIKEEDWFGYSIKSEFKILRKVALFTQYSFIKELSGSGFRLGLSYKF